MKRINDVWCVPDGDELITRKILESRKPNSDPTHIDLYYERRVREAALSRVTNFGTFVDAGANVGIWSRPMSSLFKKVEAFEPAEKNRECLLINLGDIDNVEIFHHGLGDSNCEGNLYLGVKNCGDCKIVYRDSIKGVPFTDEAIETIKKHKPVIVFEIDQDKDQCCEILESLGAERVTVASKCLMIYAFKE